MTALKKIKKMLAVMLATLMSATMFAGMATVSATPDLRVSDLWRGYIGTTRHWQIGYTLYNAGPTDIEDEAFSDAGWYYWGAWYKIAASEKRHTNFDLDAQTYSDNYFYNWYAPPGIHTLSQWTDIYEEVPDSDYSNNYKQMTRNWNDL